MSLTGFALALCDKEWERGHIPIIKYQQHVIKLRNSEVGHFHREMSLVRHFLNKMSCPVLLETFSIAFPASDAFALGKESESSIKEGCWAFNGWQHV